MADRGEIAEIIGTHRWKDMGVDWCSCECGAILRDSDDYYGPAFPADLAFRLHLADAILALDDLAALRSAVDTADAIIGALTGHEVAEADEGVYRALLAVAEALEPVRRSSDSQTGADRG